MLLTLGACGRRSIAPEAAGSLPDAVPVSTAEPVGLSGSEVSPGRQDGERFEEVIILEGMEETVSYEHIRNDTLGFEMDYDYELFERHGETDCESFVCRYDTPGDPENYLEVRYNPQDAETVAAAVSAALSMDYEISRNDSFMLARSGPCIRIDASADIGGLTMPDRLQMVYIIPADDGCRVAVAHYFIEGAEGFGRRFHYLMDTFSVVESRGDKRVSDEQALAAVRRYCLIGNPDLAGIENAGEYPVYWDIQSSDEQEIVVLFRSYTGAQIRYHIDPVSGEAYVTELVPGVTSGEARTDERLNVWDYSF
jgi:hypothetical protein